jgi:hypothetical protein
MKQAIDEDGRGGKEKAKSLITAKALLLLLAARFALLFDFRAVVSGVHCYPREFFYGQGRQPEV